MRPPLFPIISASPAVTALLGSDPVRFFPFGEAPQGVALPYAVWQIVGGLPENYLGQAPDADTMTVQIDVYAASEPDAESAALVLRDAIEPHAYITIWRGGSRDPQTRDYLYSFDVDMITPRSP